MGEVWMMCWETILVITCVDSALDPNTNEQKAPFPTMPVVHNCMRNVCCGYLTNIFVNVDGTCFCKLVLHTTFDR